MKRLIGLLLIFVALFTPLSVCAATQVDDMSAHIVEGQLAQASASSVQEWLDGALTDGAGQTAEWYVLSLAQSGENYDFSRYRQALSSYAHTNTVSAVTRQKYALLLAATGSTDAYIAHVMKDTIGEQGIMSVVYGLHLLNNGYRSDTVTASAVVNELLSLQLEDGGWALTGSVGDTDVTAMTVQALAPYYEQDDAVMTAVNAALSLLSSRQTENGDCSGMGQACAESTAQVIVALSSLGMDCQTNQRFIKNGNTLFDGLLRYQTENGYCHTRGGEESISATSQALYALVSYRRMTDGKSGLYSLDHRRLDLDTAPAVNTTVTATTVTSAAVVAAKTVGDYKPLATVIAVGIGAGLLLLLVVLKKHRMKNILAVAILTMAAVAVVWMTTFESADNYYGTPPATENAVGAVTVSVDSIILGDDGGVIVPPVSVPLEEGDTVYDVLVKVAKERSLQLDVRGGYVAAIDHVYEFDHGDLSGWMFFVNGKEASVGCDAYVLADGDTVEWRYTRELGADLR